MNGAGLWTLYFSHDKKTDSCQTLFSDAVRIPSFLSLSTLPSLADWRFVLLLSTDGLRMAVEAFSVAFTFRARGKEETATNPSVLLVRKANAAPEPSPADFLSLLTGQNQAM